MKRRMENPNAGMAMLLALLFIAAALVILNTVAVRLKSDVRQSDTFVQANGALNAVEFALSRSVAELEAGRTGCIGVGQWAGLSNGKVAVPNAGMPGGLALPAFDETGVTPVKTPDGSADYWVVALDWASDGLDNNGDGMVDGMEETGLYGLYAAARCQATERRVEAIYRAGEGEPRLLARVAWRELAP